MLNHLWNKWIIDWHIKSFRAFWHNIITFPKHLYEFIKEVCFLLKYGYPYEATYEHFNWFLDMERSILKRYLKTHYGFPGSEGAETNEKWESVIKRMLELLEDMDETKYDETISTINKSDSMEKSKNEFFELYSKWFYNLWD